MLELRGRVLGGEQDFHRLPTIFATINGYNDHHMLVCFTGPSTPPSFGNISSQEQKQQRRHHHNHPNNNSHKGGKQRSTGAGRSGKAPPPSLPYPRSAISTVCHQHAVALVTCNSSASCLTPPQLRPNAGADMMLTFINVTATILVIWILMMSASFQAVYKQVQTNKILFFLLII